MGVVNVTPDSFSDGGRYLDPEGAIQRGLSLVRDGADLLDVGGESTRPGSAPVSAEEELARVLPVLRGLAVAGVPLSIDTSKAEVAAAACGAGATIVNDVTSLSDPAMARVVAHAGASLCLMHMQGTPATMQEAPTYRDVVAEVGDALALAVERAVAAGVMAERIVVDPGIGFGKRLEHNLALVAACGTLMRRVGRPVLVGVSRKRFLGELTGRPVEDRRFGTAAAVTACVLAGARIVRVHDVAEMRDVVRVADAIRRAHGEALSDGRDSG